MGKVDTKKKGAAPAKHPPAPVTQALATRSTEVSAPVNVDDLLLADVGSGMEGMTRDDFAIPRLAILQALSPQINKRDDSYVEGAEAGMIYDSVSNALYDGEEGVLAVVVAYRKAYLQWWPRNSSKGKGFIKDWGADPSILDQTTRTDKGANLLPDGSEIVPTAEYYCLIVDESDGTYERVLIPMAKTQLIKSKKLNTVASSLMIPVKGVLKQAPLFYRAYRFAVKPESNDKGNWFGWDVTPGPALLANSLKLPVLPGGETIYMEARGYQKAVAANKVKVAAPVSDDHGSAGSSPNAGGDEAPM